MLRDVEDEDDSAVDDSSSFMVQQAESTEQLHVDSTINNKNEGTILLQGKQDDGSYNYQEKVKRRTMSKAWLSPSHQHQQHPINTPHFQRRLEDNLLTTESSTTNPTAAIVDDLGSFKLDDETGNDGSQQTTPSSIRYTQDPLTGAIQREGHLMVHLPLTMRIPSSTNEQQSSSSSSSSMQQQQQQQQQWTRRQLIEFRVYIELSAFLAYKHIQRRSGSVLPDLPRRLESCDFTWTYKHYDTEFSPLRAATNLINHNYVYGHNNNKNSDNNNNDNNIPSVLSSPQSNSNNATFPPTIIHQSNSTLVSNEQITVVSNDIDVFDNEDENEDNGDNEERVITAAATTEQEDNNSQKPPTRRKRRRRQQQRQVNQISDNDSNSDNLRSPFAMMGAARSVVSETLAILGNAYDLPQISSSSTSSTLDAAPLFARTVPTNQGDAHAIMVYLHRLQVTNVGVLFIKDNWGRRYEQDLQEYAKRYNITVHAVAYIDEAKLDSAMQQLQQSKVRYFVGIINPSAWKSVVRKAYQYGIMGNKDYQWFLGDLLELVGDSFTLDRTTEWDLAQALHGSGVVFIKLKPHSGFDRAVAAFSDNRVMQEEFVSLHSEPHLFDNFTFLPSPGRSLYQYLTYDAVIALGLTACDTPGLFNGRDYYDQLRRIDFEGVSGRVNLHETTGTRRGEGIEYQVVNLVLKGVPPQAMKLSFDARTSITIDLSPELPKDDLNSTILPLIEVNQLFVYNDNTTTPPLPLPPVEEDMNLIPNSVVAFGLSLSCFVMLLSIGFALWAYAKRNVYVVRASQPIFLISICVGTFIMAATVIPLSFQEDMPGLDIACKCIPWSVSIGFTVAIASLYSKAHRVNKLMNSGSTFRRVKVEPADVIKPFLILLTINIVILTAWTASPWSFSWQRESVENNVDSFGRSVESYGLCKTDSYWFLAFFIPLVLANVTIMVIATYESYKGRNLPSEFSETRYLALAMISLCETFTLGVTTIIAVLNHPTGFFLVVTLVICIACLSILLPVFLPKYHQRNVRERNSRNTASLLLDHNGNSFHWTSKLPSSNVDDKDEDVSEFSSRSGRRNTMTRAASRAANDFFASKPQAIRRGSSGGASIGSSSKRRSHISGLEVSSRQSFSTNTGRRRSSRSGWFGGSSKQFNLKPHENSPRSGWFGGSSKQFALKPHDHPVPILPNTMGMPTEPETQRHSPLDNVVSTKLRPLPERSEATCSGAVISELEDLGNDAGKDDAKSTATSGTQLDDSPCTNISASPLLDEPPDQAHQEIQGALIDDLMAEMKRDAKEQQQDELMKDKYDSSSGDEQLLGGATSTTVDQDVSLSATEKVENMDEAMEHESPNE